MPVDHTLGFDAVFELSDTAVSGLVPPLAPFRRRIDRDVTIPGVGTFPVRADFEFMPTSTSIEFAPQVMDNGVTIAVEFNLNVENHNLQGFPDPEGFRGGNLRVTHPISVFTTDGDRSTCLGMDFTQGIDTRNIDVDLTSAGLGALTPRVEGAVAILVQTLLQTHLQYVRALALPLSPGDSNPRTFESCDVRVVSTDCLAVLLCMMPDRGGDPSRYQTSHLGHGESGVVLTSNRWLLQDLLCPLVAEYFNITPEIDPITDEPVSPFEYSDAQSVLRDPQSVDHLVDHALVDHVTLEALRIYVGQGFLGADGRFSIRGYGWRASAPAEAIADIEITDAGDIEISPTVQPGHVSTAIEAWAIPWVILGAVLVPVLAIPGILSGLMSGLADLVATVFADALREFEESIILDVPPLPIDIDRIELDDLAYAGRLVLPERWEPEEPSVRIEGEMEASDARQTGMDMGQITGVVWEMRTTYSRSHHGRFSAETRNMLFPINYEWSLQRDAQRHVLTGDGAVDIQGVSVRYQVDGRLCQLWLEEGDSLEAELRVNATDDNGNSSSAYNWIDVEGTNSSRIIIGGELLMGPSALEFLYMWQEARSLVPDIIEEQPDWSAIAGELSTALHTGMDMDLDPTVWAGPSDYEWPKEPSY